MSYLPFAIAAPVFMAIGNYIQKLVVSDSKVHAGVFGGAYGLLVGLLSLPFALLYEKFDYTLITFNTWLILIVMTTLYAIAMWGFFTAMKYVPISEVVFLESSTPMWVLFGSILFLGEVMTWNKLVGIILLIIGLLVAFKYKGVSNWSKYHSLGLISGALYAGAYLTDKYLLAFIPTIYYQVLSFSLPSIVLLIFFGSRIANLKYFVINQNARKIVWSSLFVGLGYYALFTAYKMSDTISLVNPIFETKALWSMFFGIILLHETDNLKHKIVGIIISMIGVFLVNY